MGRWRTQSLFKEFYLNALEPVFTLKEFDDGDLPSIRQLFLAYNDITGYHFAKEVLGSYEHWKRLVALPWFKEHLDDWLIELEVRAEADALKRIREVSQGESGSALPAAKYLANKGWITKKGRPKKEDIEREAKIAAGVEAEVEGDLERIRVVK
jgi:hypothetical protein